MIHVMSFYAGTVSAITNIWGRVTESGQSPCAGIQKNPLKLLEPNLFVFDVIDLGNDGFLKKHGLNGIKDYCDKLNLAPVPVEETGDSFNYTLDELLEKARGKYASGRDKEGIVVRTREYGQSAVLQHKMSFKVINNDFLKKEKD